MFFFDWLKTGARLAIAKRPNMLVEERHPRKMTLTFSFRNVYEDKISQIDLGPLTLHFLEANMNNPCEPECKPDQRLENG